MSLVCSEKAKRRRRTMQPWYCGGFRIAWRQDERPDLTRRVVAVGRLRRDVAALDALLGVEGLDADRDREAVADLAALRLARVELDVERELRRILAAFGEEQHDEDDRGEHGDTDREA